MKEITLNEQQVEFLKTLMDDGIKVWAETYKKVAQQIINKLNENK